MHNYEIKNIAKDKLKIYICLCSIQNIEFIIYTKMFLSYLKNDIYNYKSIFYIVYNVKNINQNIIIFISKLLAIDVIITVIYESFGKLIKKNIYFKITNQNNWKYLSK